MSDKELDALFKKAADNLEVPYNSKGWKGMQARLNRAGGGYWGGLRKGLIGLTVLLLVLGTAWWLNESRNTEAQLEEKIELSQARQAYSAEKFPIVPPPPILAEDKTEGQESVDTEGQALKEGAKMEENQSAFEQNTEMTQADEGTTNANAGFTGIILNEIDKSETVRLLNANGIAQDKWKMPKQTLHLLGVTETAPAQEDVVVNRRQLVNRWGISFALSPDLSSVGFQDIHNVSTKAAIQLEFFVLPNLSVSSGAVFTKKVYSASPDDYQQKYQYKNIPVGINGQCQVLDIPLNLRWYALSGAKSRFFISGGLSSYMMLTEDYEYVYKESGKYGKYYSRDYGYKHENNHLFKVANISLGYERALGNHWAMQVEPFVKLPLAGVGEGSLKLSTLGTFLSVHYRWGKR
ncbi:hypothetical protein [Catalinimonas alkaloidigena]|uniref:hypothetical protein n=1 Tax=Catalinimonas alkaloidigena TaxID=1075417 RepID=UPI002406AF06|nr:hypothetical protein [Catalinimonas alkaloidigena]